MYVLSHKFAYLEPQDDFYGDANYLGLVAPFNKASAFHVFIEFVVENLIAEEVGQVDLEKRRTMHEAYPDIPAALEDMRLT